MGRERERTRIKSRIDEFPEDIVTLINQRLADVNISYQSIADEVTGLGFDISRSTIGKYALKQNEVAKRLKDSFEKTRALIQTVKENQDMEAADIAGTIFMDALTKRIATAEEEFDDLPLDKAGRLLIQLQRSTVYKEKFKLEYKKGIKDSVEIIKAELKRELSKEPELLKRMVELTEKAAYTLEGVNNG
jgi:hypothetical protein